MKNKTKKIILLAMLIAFSSTFQSQNKIEPKKDLILLTEEYSPLNYNSFSPVFEQNWLLTKADLSDSILIDSIITNDIVYNSSSKQVFDYNETGAVKSILGYYMNLKREWEKHRKLNFQYNQHDDRIGSTVYSRVADEWEFDYSDTLIYNYIDNEYTRITKIWNGDTWKNMYRTHSFLDSSGNIRRSIGEDWQNNEWIKSSELYIAYLPNGLRDSLRYDFGQNDIVAESFYSKFEYDPDWNLSKILNRRLSGEEWINNIKVSYLGKDNIDTVTTQIWNQFNEKWQISTRYIESYISNNFISYIKHESWDGNSWRVDYGVSVFEYPGGYTEGFITHELFIYYSKPTGIKHEEKNPTDFHLSQNYPNPFNPTTTIEFSIPESSHIRLVVYNTIGEVVAELLDQHLTTGKHTVQFNGSDLPSGIYIYRLQASDYNSSGKMMLIK